MVRVLSAVRLAAVPAFQEQNLGGEEHSGLAVRHRLPTW
jgi:hypothetical protein